MKLSLRLPILVTLLFPALASAATLKFIVMAAENPQKEAPKYEALAKYVGSRGGAIDRIDLTVARNFPHALSLFESGEADGMFSGSFVGAVLIRKGLAKPVVRPRSEDGTSTYKALILAREKTKPFSGLQDLRGKRVAYCALASAGEIFLKSLLPEGEKLESVLSPRKTNNHQEAILEVVKGLADYAVVKNLVWDPGSYPGVAVVGADSGENPNNVLLLTPKVYDTYAWDLRRLLMKASTDDAPEALALRKAFGIKSFINTTEEDYAHTFELIEKARLDPKTFAF